MWPPQYEQLAKSLMVTILLIITSLLLLLFLTNITITTTTIACITPPHHSLLLLLTTTSVRWPCSGSSGTTRRSLSCPPRRTFFKLWVHKRRSEKALADEALSQAYARFAKADGE